MLNNIIVPTDQQLAAIAATRNSTDSILLEAYAGAAKTTTLTLMAKEIKIPALALAFNVSIKKELAGKFSSNFSVQTMNGLGYAALMRALPTVNFSVDAHGKKLGKIIREVLKDFKIDLGAEQYDGVRDVVRQCMIQGLVPKEFSQAKPLIADSEENWLALMENAGIGENDFPMVEELCREILVRDIEMALQGFVSFDDQVYVSTLVAGRFPQFPAVLGDEIQDFSPLNHAMLTRAVRPDGRLIMVGDKRQCHPIGTQIYLSSGRRVTIEDIRIGDQVVSYNRKIGFTGTNTQGRKVTAKKIFDFSGDLVRISAGNYSHDCTPNHKCMVRLDTQEGYIVYLMKRGNNYRIGSSKVMYSDETFGFGPAMRARQEKADAVWLLDWFPTKEEAILQEKVIWTMFGLPDLIFKSSGKSSSSQAHLDKAWEQMGNNEVRAKLCLEHFGREIEFPIWEKTREVKTPIGIRSFITQACNLVSGLMSVCTDDGWKQCWIDRIPYNGPVIGITVESNGYGLSLYVANGIVTHNSIYQFRGADVNSIAKIKALRSRWIELPLTITFRCPKVVVQRQLFHAPGFQAGPANKAGLFVRLPIHPGLLPDTDEPAKWNWSNVEAVVPQGASMAVLCRNNAPILKLAFKLLAKRKSIKILGREIGRGIIALTKQLAPRDATPKLELASLVALWEDREKSLALANDQSEKLDMIEDKAECVRAVLSYENVSDAGDCRRELNFLFSREEGAITLASIHKAKGLEWDLVLLLDPWRMPSKWAREKAKLGQDGELQQEMNLKYVAETRTKDVLIHANMEDFE